MDDVADCGPECTETQREIETFLDGEVDTVLRARIELHLAECGPCTGKAEFRQHLKELVRDRCHESQVPDALAERIRALLREPG
jgi:mycothiol system anti-sigma-R factor